MKEIRFHGRGGQGAVMASELLVHALVREGNYGQSIPAYGFERRGAPLQAFVKLDHKPIRERVQVYEPDGIIVLDESLISQLPIFEGMKHGGFAILNSRKTLAHSDLPEELETLATIDANRIALNVFKAPITNTILLGAFASATGLVKLDSLQNAISGFFPGKVIEKNLLAVERGYNEVEVTVRTEILKKAK
ncbi:2-oxoacid:acceptor oxidoreductase family protein [Mesobacillus selenatarsenatis]|uniref:Pyruvateferredoxin oxidoreductase, gamma subunit n=1 Tax=Mesobacillus selenatarsenatis (strain DSM 18680 / JCM 14380 / FERM P-15431 / SF-1) TaxID=1321606 RepID=A0A0A8X513_MESS1|nr:2-oxoacid:acceptor oxidoreductase family protein [Mesobacillus selenatarsenatis]GAM13231.1 pyruvateferredoxin oxidoreductase, gamma subunit [Mesobacillus selenatarsenatis SF-1]